MNFVNLTLVSTLLPDGSEKQEAVEIQPFQAVRKTWEVLVTPNSIRYHKAPQDQDCFACEVYLGTAIATNWDTFWAAPAQFLNGFGDSSRFQWTYTHRFETKKNIEVETLDPRTADWLLKLPEGSCEPAFDDEGNPESMHVYAFGDERFSRLTVQTLELLELWGLPVYLEAKIPISEPERIKLILEAQGFTFPAGKEEELLSSIISIHC